MYNDELFSKMWYLIDAEDKSLCVVFEKNILQAGSRLGKGDKVVFFHRGIEYTGTILSINGDKAVLDSELNKTKAQMAKEAKEKAARALLEPQPLPAKRKVAATQFYGKACSSQSDSRKKNQSEARSKMSEEEKKRQQILQLNKKQSQRYSNKIILDHSQKKSRGHDDDEDWNPIDDEKSMDSIVDVATSNENRQALRDNLIEQILNEDDMEDKDERNDAEQDTSNVHHARDTLSSPSKDELKRQLDQLRQELQKAKGSKPNYVLSPAKSRRESSSPQKKRIESDACNTPSKRKTMNEHGSNSGSTMKERRNDGSSPFIGNFEDIFQDDMGEDTPNKKKSKSTNGGNSASSTPKKRRKRDGSSPLKHSKEDSFSNDLNDISTGGDGEDVGVIADHAHLNYQLYGNCENTKLICHGIYCKTDSLTKAISSSHNVNHVIRRLMEGVFKAESIQNCTVTGQSWHAGGDDEKKKEMKPLHPTALKAIVAFANKFAKSQKWSTKKFEKAKPIFAVKLTEMKKRFSSTKK